MMDGLNVRSTQDLILETVGLGQIHLNGTVKINGINVITEDELGYTNSSFHASIQTALDVVRVAGGGTVIVPPATYTLNFSVHPQDATYASLLRIGSKTRLVLAPGTIIKLANNASAIGGVTSYSLLLNYDITGATGDVDIAIEGGTFDGNGNNQTLITHGVVLMRTTDCEVNNVTVKNCRGTAGSGVNENFFFEAQLGARTVYRNCRAISNAGSTSSGFSANSSTAIRYESCLASGMTVANGFTHNDCSGVWHDKCFAFDNTGHGFNSEISTNVAYVQCVAGIASAPNAISKPYGNAEQLGNGQHGFACAYQSQAMYVECTAKYNSYGITVNDESPGVGSYGQIIGGDFSNNTVNGIAYGAACTGMVSGHPRLIGNGVAEYTLGSAGYTAENGLISVPPAIPASGVTFTNPFPFDVVINIIPPTNANIYFIQLGPGLPNTNRASGTFMLAAGAQLKINYGDAPTWEWWFNGSAPIGPATTAATYVGQVTWDPPSVVSGAQTNTTVTVTGAAVGDMVAVGFTIAVPAGVLLVGAVTATNTVTVTMFNISGGTVDLGSGVLRARVWKLI